MDDDFDAGGEVYVKISCDFTLLFVYKMDVWHIHSLDNFSNASTY